MELMTKVKAAPPVGPGVTYSLVDGHRFIRRHETLGRSRRRTLAYRTGYVQRNNRQRVAQTVKDHPDGNHIMSRVNDALSSLVSALIPALPEEDEASADKRHEDALLLTKEILRNHEKLAEAYDINHVSDLIKKKLWRENDAPDKAIQYSNLYSRLLTLPILTQKWGILYLLHQLAEPGSEGKERFVSESPPPATNQSHRETKLGSARARVNELSSATQNHEQPAYGLDHDPMSKVNGHHGNQHQDTPSTREGGKAIAGIEEFTPNSQVDKPTEAALLRDLPFVLQGLSSTNFIFTSTTTVQLPPSLPIPLISLLHTLAEPSLLYRSLSDFVQSRDEGLIGQSLKSAIGTELRSYLGLIATLEGEIRRAIATVTETGSRPTIGKAGVTLKRCVVWTRDATMGLRLMSLMAEESENRKGGQLISLIHSFSTSYGDPFVAAFAERMLAHLTRPFYEMLRQWIYDGELSDPYHEFFIIEQDQQNKEREIDPRRVPATSVWEDKYRLDHATVPSIITENFAKKVFLIGKSLNFIRYGCGDSAWVQAYSKEASKELHYGDTATLESSIDQAYKTTMARLIHLMNNKFKLNDHLDALKKYLLLGQGDFIALLMESLSSNLDRPAGSQYRHTLTAQLEHAIRGSNAQYDSPDVLRRLDARLLELSHGEIGWDVFTLEYKVDAPVDVIITAWANKQYLVVFNFLWRIKRVEFALGSTWRRYMTGARGVLASVDEKLGRDWKIARCCIAEMIHFVNQLQYYILFEVIEASWDQLQAAIARPDCTLDDLIDAHTTYLKAITHKGLLGSARSSITGTREDSFASQLHYILKIMLAYKDAVDGLYSFSVTEFTRKQELAAKTETRTSHGKWALADRTDDDLDSPFPGDRIAKGKSRLPERDADSPTPMPILTAAGDDQMLPSLRKRLQELSVDFRARLTVLLGDLSVQPDVDMKFLGVVMNFNDVYRPERRKKRREGGKDKDRKTPAEKGGGENARRKEVKEGASELVGAQRQDEKV
ncbi:Microtubule-nucleating Tub4p (gamma-tubulin) complex component [Lambiella insularis]|nr:Microtubule-nucleating Tub4p (gamma-tubulin) complex component [Lambiella insularis]